MVSNLINYPERSLGKPCKILHLFSSCQQWKLFFYSLFLRGNERHIPLLLQISLVRNAVGE